MLITRQTMRRYLLSIFLTAAVMSSGCSKSDTSDYTATSGTVRFLAGINGREDNWGGLSTRGVPIDNATIHQFSVYCFQTGRKQWVDTMAYALPNKLCDVLVTRDGNDWNYDPPVLWEGGDGAYFTFFGYSPRATGIYQEPELPLGNNLELVSSATDPGVPVLKYSTLDYIPTQIDLLISAPVYDTHPVDRVQMKFAHALSQIRFMAWSDQDFVRVKRIEISNVQYTATLDLAGGLTPLPDVKAFTLDEINKTLSTDQSKMTDLSDGGNAFLLLPQDLTGNTTAKIVVTYIVNGVESQSAPYTIIQNWERGNSYTYTLKMGGNPTEEMVVTGVNVTDWIIDGEENLETNPTPEAPYKIHPPTENEYVVVNGLKWTSGNLVAVNEKECKVGKITDMGLSFQFGSLIGWTGGATGDGTGQGAIVTAAIQVKPYGYTATPLWRDCPHTTGVNVRPLGDATTAIGDPCSFYLGQPWRLPTEAEFLAMIPYGGSGSNWAAYNGVYASVDGVAGAWINSLTQDYTKDLFLPFGGIRTWGDGNMNFTTDGIYWTSTKADLDYSTFYCTQYTPMINNMRSEYGASVRCVCNN